MEGTRVLIVEDEPGIAAVLKNQLHKLGYKDVDLAASGDEAIGYIEQKEPPGLIFMDIFLRGSRNGVDTASEIYKRAKIPIIFSSAPENLYIIENAKFIKNTGFLSTKRCPSSIKLTVCVVSLVPKSS
jgi:CheY-like chemotaxis protein